MDHDTRGARLEESRIAREPGLEIRRIQRGVVAELGLRLKIEARREVDGRRRRRYRLASCGDRPGGALPRTPDGERRRRGEGVRRVRGGPLQQLRREKSQADNEERVHRTSGGNQKPRCRSRQAFQHAIR